MTRYAYEHLIIYVDAAREKQVWQWVKRESGARSAPHLNRYHRGQSGELLAQKLEKLAIALEAALASALPVLFFWSFFNRLAFSRMLQGCGLLELLEKRKRLFHKVIL